MAWPKRFSFFSTIIRTMPRVGNLSESSSKLTMRQWLLYAVAVLGFTFGGQWGGHNCSWGGTDLYCHSEPPLTSGKLCFIINFIGGGTRGQNFYWGRPLPPPLWIAPDSKDWPSNLGQDHDRALNFSDRNKGSTVSCIICDRWWCTDLPTDLPEALADPHSRTKPVWPAYNNNNNNNNNNSSAIKSEDTEALANSEPAWKPIL